MYGVTLCTLQCSHSSHHNRHEADRPAVAHSNYCRAEVKWATFVGLREPCLSRNLERTIVPGYLSELRHLFEEIAQDRTGLDGRSRRNFVESSPRSSFSYPYCKSIFLEYLQAYTYMHECISSRTEEEDSI